MGDPSNFDDGRAERKPGYGAEPVWDANHWNVYGDSASPQNTGDMNPREWIGLGPTQTLFFTEVADPKDSYQSRYVEFYSPDSAGQVIGQVDGNDLYLGRAANADSDYTKYKNILSGATIGADGFFIVCYSLADFTTSYPGKTCDLESSNVNSNGDDAYVVCILFYILCFVMSMDMYIS